MGNGLYFTFRHKLQAVLKSVCDGTAGRPDSCATDGEDEGMTAKVTVEEVDRVAELAHLELTPEERGHMLNDLNAILDYVAELNELDTAGGGPLAQGSEVGEAGSVRTPRGRGPQPLL